MMSTAALAARWCLGVFRSKHKNDRVDAEKLAMLLFLDEVPAVYTRTENRRELVADRTRARNALRAFLRSLGIKAPRNLWSPRGRAWLAGLNLRQERIRVLTEMAFCRIGPQRAACSSKGYASFSTLDAEVLGVSRHRRGTSAPTPSL